MPAPHPLKLGPGMQSGVLAPRRGARKREKDTNKKGRSGIRATLEERTQDACVGTQRREQRRLWRIRDASEREGASQTGVGGLPGAQAQASETAGGG